MALPWKTLASVRTPDGQLELRKRGEKDFLITIDNRVLMSSSEHRSETELAQLGCAGLRKVPRARVLVSGLGMGFTLRAALDELADDAEVGVADLNPVVVEWCQGPLAPLIDDAARDPRVAIEIVDVAEHIARVARRFDQRKYHAIVLDMYQGPQTHVRPNDPLYGPAAMRLASQALVPGGALAVWGEAPSGGFERNLRAAGFDFRGHRCGRGGRRHYVYTARATRKVG